MILVEQTTVPGSALPVAEFREHLRLGSGFGEDGLQDGVLESFLRAAIAAIEARTGKALLERRFMWTLVNWRDTQVQRLPVAPVVAIQAIRLIGPQGSESVMATSSYRLILDSHAPEIQAVATSLPTVPTGGSVEIEFDAGFGPAWADIPSDLGHAVLLLASYYYDNRKAGSDDIAVIPFGVAALIERYRVVRLGGGK